MKKGWTSKPPSGEKVFQGGKVPENLFSIGTEPLKINSLRSGISIALKFLITGMKAKEGEK